MRDKIPLRAREGATICGRTRARGGDACYPNRYTGKYRHPVLLSARWRAACPLWERLQSGVRMAHHLFEDRFA
jgi:hypothetical protein